MFLLKKKYIKSLTSFDDIQLSFSNDFNFFFLFRLLCPFAFYFRYFFFRNFYSVKYDIVFSRVKGTKKKKLKSTALFIYIYLKKLFFFFKKDLFFRRQTSRFVFSKYGKLREYFIRANNKIFFDSYWNQPKKSKLPRKLYETEQNNFFEGYPRQKATLSNYKFIEIFNSLSIRYY